MLFAILFEDDAARADEIRRRDMPAHLAFLERHARAIQAAGPLRDAGDDSPAGGLWLVEAENSDAVDRLVREDPFWSAGLRRSARVLVWNQVFAGGARLI